MCPCGRICYKHLRLSTRGMVSPLRCYRVGLRISSPWPDYAHSRERVSSKPALVKNEPRYLIMARRFFLAYRIAVGFESVIWCQVSPSVRSDDRIIILIRTSYRPNVFRSVVGAILSCVFQLKSLTMHEKMWGAKARSRSGMPRSSFGWPCHRIGACS